MMALPLINNLMDTVFFYIRFVFAAIFIGIPLIVLSAIFNIHPREW